MPFVLKHKTKTLFINKAGQKVDICQDPNQATVYQKQGSAKVALESSNMEFYLKNDHKMRPSDFHPVSVKISLV